MKYPFTLSTALLLSLSACDAPADPDAGTRIDTGPAADAPLPDAPGLDVGPLPDVGVAPDGGMPSATCPRGFTQVGTSCTPVPGGTSYYVRVDGGSHTQCDGTTDAPYVAGGGRACAFRHPFDAIPPRGSTRTAPLQGGDVLFIGAGDYAIGAGVVTDSGYAGCNSSAGGVGYDCEVGSIPSGTAERPTRIVGAGFDRGCTDAPELWGTWRTPSVLNLTDADHISIACLDLTDHQDCTRNHASSDFRCDADIGVVEGYANSGIYATDSEDVQLTDLRIHGLDTGVYAARITDWTLDRVVLRGNVSAGFDGDVSGDDHNGGTITFRDGEISWSGCIERYPDSSAEPVGCLSQDRGGYGDGLGTGATGGRWIFERFNFLYNVSDGLDLLYLDTPEAHVEVRESHFEGNGGNAIKVAESGHLIHDVSIVANCGFLAQPRWPDMVNPCRAQGAAISLGSGALENVVENVTLWAEGDCAITSNGGRINLRNSILVGNGEYLQTDDRACFIYGEPTPTVSGTVNVINGFKTSNNGCAHGINASGAMGCADPMLRAISTGSRTDPDFDFDLRLSPASPFVDHVPPLGALSR